MKPEDIEYQAQQFVQWFGKRTNHYATQPGRWFDWWASTKSFSQADRDAILRAVLEPGEIDFEPSGGPTNIRKVVLL